MNTNINITSIDAYDNVTNIFKSMSYTGKRTTISAIDEYFFIENSSFVFQDLYKNVVLKLEKSSISENYMVKRADMINVLQKGAKYYFHSIKDSMMILIRVSKGANKEDIFQTCSVPLKKGTLNISEKMNQITEYNNSFETNGYAMKTLFKGIKSAIGLGFEDKSLLIALDDDEYISFDDNFGAMCSATILKSDDSKSKIMGNILVATFNLLGVTSKNNTVEISFNLDSFKLTKDNLSVIILANK